MGFVWTYADYPMKLDFAQVTIWRRLRRGASGYYHHCGSLPLALPVRHERGEGWGEGARSIELANWNHLSLTLSPLLRRGERESTSGMVVVSSCAPTDGEPAPPLLRHAVDRRNNGA